MHPTIHSVAVRRLLVRSLALALTGSAFVDAGAAAARGLRPRSAMHADAGTAPAPDGANLSVTSCADSGPGTLRQAMLDARNNTTVDFSQLSCSTITLTTGALTDPDTDSLKLIATPVVVGGRPQPRLTIDGGGTSRIIEHRTGGQLELQGIALRNGHSNEGKGGCLYALGHTSMSAVTITGCTATASGSAYALGGGVWSDDEIDLVYSTISGNRAIAAPGGYAYGGGVSTPYGLYAVYSTIRGNEATGLGYGGGASVLGPTFIAFSTIDSNTAAYGAGLALFGGDVGPGELQIVSSTIAANHATGFAAGVEANASLEIQNSTLAFNTADRADATSHGGGVVMQGAHVLNLVSSIVARNQQGGVAHDIGGSGSITGSTNLVMSSTLTLPGGTLSANPMLAALASGGGQTDTLALQPGSPAIDTGSNPFGTLCDQRAGSYRPPFNIVGVYERQKGAAVDIGAFESGAGDAFFGDGFDEIPSFSCRP